MVVTNQKAFSQNDVDMGFESVSPLDKSIKSGPESGFQNHEKKVILRQTHHQERTLLQLPSDFLKTPTTPYQPEWYQFALSDRLTSLLHRSDDMEERSLLLAAFNVLLYRYTQQETISLKLTIHKLATAETSIMEICTHLSGQLKVQELIGYTSVALKGIRGQSGALQERLLVHNRPNVQSDLPVAVTFIDGSSVVEDWEEWVPTEENSDLHLLIFQQGQAISGLLKYNANLFKPDTIKRVSGHLQVLVEGMLSEQSWAIAQLPLLTQAESHQLRVEWASIPAPYPQNPIHRKIEVHAVQQPDAIALTFKDQHLTYAELNQRANQLAHYLISAGVGAETRVAVCVQPSLEVLVALLGVFKAGGVYVPLDPTYPIDRLSVILEDTQPRVLLTQSHLLPNLPVTSKSVFYFDRDWETIQHQPTHNPRIEIASDQTAYIVYTSGTTGKPKGVMVSHKNLVNYIQVAQDRYGFNQNDVMPAIARFTFSITFFELLSPLVAGGRLVILERDHILDFKRMTQTLEEVTVVHASPSLLKKLLVYIQDNGLDIQKFDNLRHVSSGGDIVSADLLETMKRVFRHAEIYVIYGCSEVSCMGCTFPVRRNEIVTKTWVGKPFSNVSVRLYDPHQNLVPIGVVGEIYIGGTGVAKGYLNRDELTQEKFVVIDGQRFYRTGDLGRFSADGNLEILGRSDFQIQLRGIRIEPGEIETTLRQFPGVREAVVVARELWNGEEGLVAYLVLDKALNPTIENIRLFLQAKLPDYMVPARLMVLDALPVNANQKVDRRALPAPELAPPDSNPASYVAPRTRLEELLVDIWAKTLGVERVGVEDDFFALGGHSLLAAQVIYRLQAALKLEIPISRLFERPTIATLAEYLSPLCESGTPHSATWEPITPTARETNLPASFSQEQLWFLSHLEGGSVAYNIPLAFRLVGALNVVALEQSLTEIVRRHETLRTTFPVVDGSPIQQILPPPPFRLSVVDLQALPETDRIAEVHRLGREEAQQPFNLAVDLLLRGKLLQLGEGDRVLLLTMHHIASDGWSLALFRKELATLYTAFSQGAASPLSPLPIQYADFVHWQQQWLQQDFVHQQLAYWKQQLAGAPSLLELPSDRPRPAIQSFRGGTESVTLDVELTRQLKQLSQRTGSTLYMTLLAVFATLLSRYSGCQDLVIGSPVANRKRSEIESLIGFFINLLALRVNLKGNPSFLELLGRVRQVALDAYANQDVPFERVVEAVQPERNLSYSPLFQVLLILQNTPAESLNFPGLTVTPLRVDHGTSKYDLTLMVEETEAGLVADFEYNGDLFDRVTITRMIGHFQTLLQAIVSDPEQPIAALPLLTDSERHQLLVEWNDTALAYPQDHCIHQLIEAQVERTPDKIAIVFEQSSLTYRELNQRANQLAHTLRSQGVGPDSLIGICVERSLEMVVGLLGILKAGGSYVPLDPAYPRERLALMIEDSQLPLLITQQALRNQFSEPNVQVICLDTDWPAIAQHNDENLDSGVTPENLAYTIYTSGSTGKPKGVQICHRAAVNFLHSMRFAPGLTEQDVLLAVTTISFDIAVLELYLPLMVGAQIVLATRAVASDADRLAEILAQAGVTVLQATPATWRMLLSGGWQGDRRLKMLCGGEAMPRDLADQLLEKEGELWNMYGPTETTVWSAAYQVRPGKGAVPVAGPIANTQIYVLEEFSDRQTISLRPTPIGISGEVHIGGEGLARGYLNRPELTAERFIKDPFRDQPGARLYKTGDLARYRPDGTLEFLGRIDHQVKLRGFRIELGEIESLLNQHPNVKQAVAIVREDEPGDQRLVAYLTIQGNLSPTPLELRQFLKQKLPGYMVPAAFVVLEALPLTPNGKVDRRALPVLDLSSSEGDRSDFVAPRDELERQLTEIWETVLQVKPIGIRDNFFELGGHSLSAVRVWAQVEKLLGKTLPITALLQSPTIEDIANLLRIADGDDEVLSDLVPLRTGGNKPPLFCIYGILLYRELAEHLDPDQPVYGVYLQEEVDLIKTGRVDLHSALFSNAQTIAARYLKAIRTLQPHGPYYLAGESFGGVIAYEMAQQLQAEGEEVALVALLDAVAPNSLSFFKRFQIHWQMLLKQGHIYLAERWQENMQLLRRQLSSPFRKVNQHLHSIGAQISQEFASTDSEDIRQEVRDRVLQSYFPQPYTGRVVLFRATEQNLFEGNLDKDLGWEPFIKDFHAFDVPGDHLGILKAPNVQVIADRLKPYLVQ
ncbi:amino acid adenylation domain-containing protein [Leptothermofonsia sp. ETS-13]|uniref:amino acid adenylation domain-containing protein n=1 Tax=Leptothermofonsia sp. ETS-13 TaxID=3035696 RepID=UPI003B9EEA5C